MKQSKDAYFLHDISLLKMTFVIYRTAIIQHSILSMGRIFQLHGLNNYLSVDFLVSRQICKNERINQE